MLDEQMCRVLGILQHDNTALARPAAVCPDDPGLIRRTVRQLRDAVDGARRLHKFPNGCGLSAPQLGIDLQISYIHSPYRAHPIVLVNPKVVEHSGWPVLHDEECLSRFGVCGPVPRLTLVGVESGVGDRRAARVYTRAAARLVLHEIDHLDGQAYTDRMLPGAELVPGAVGWWDYTGG